MLTGEQFLESLRDGRVTYIEGERIEDVTEHPLTCRAAQWSARVYDRFHALDPEGVNPLFEAPRSADELRERIPMMTGGDYLAGTTFQSLMTLLTVAPHMRATYPELAARIYDYVDDAKRRDIRITECITDGKGHRALAPGKQQDPDAYLHVVDRRPDGIVIRGAKF